MNRFPPSSKVEAPVRNSNLELYRILCMLMIVAHHYVVNSGLTYSEGPISTDPMSLNSYYLQAFGMYGKTGINCFLLITGYFMVKSTITVRKFIKLLLQIYLYKIIIFTIFAFTGYETVNVVNLIKLVFPFWNFQTNFTSCFIVFYLTIPFWNILINNMTQRQHQLLLCLTLGCYTFLGSIPGFHILFNYITWFGIIYLLSSYFRLYPHPIFENTKMWLIMSVISVVLAFISMLVLVQLGKNFQFFVNESNKILAVLVAVSTFLLFRNIKLPYVKFINIVGGSTFGVLLIHANSNAMRKWLWQDIVDCVGNYYLPLPNLIVYSIAVVVTIFTICIIIDRLRITYIERPFFNWFDKKYTL